MSAGCVGVQYMFCRGTMWQSAHKLLFSHTCAPSRHQHCQLSNHAQPCMGPAIAALVPKLRPPEPIPLCHLA